MTAPLPARSLPALQGGTRAVAGQHGVVVSAEAQATHAGVSLLEQGGNAVDAAVATALALAVTHPSAGNLGGGGFALVRPSAGPTLAVDFRETAPAGLTRADFDRMIAAKGSGPVAPGVPGTVAGLLLLHRRLGKAPLEQVCAPAVTLARSSVLGHEQAQLLAAHWKTLSLDPGARRVFGDAKGAPRRGGTRLEQPALAKMLEAIAALGDAAFYAGAAAQSLAKATGNHVTFADLAAYRAVVREPLTVRYRGFDVETMPPPSAGGLVLAGTLNALESLEPSPPPAETADELHRFVEISRRAQALRRFHVVDPDAQSAAERKTLAARFLDPQALLAVPVDPARATPSASVHPLYAEALRELEHTTHLAVSDASGLVVSLTTTLSASFGAKILVPETGVLLGNAVGSFSSAGDNQPVAGRRTTSSMAPTLVLDHGTPVAVLGTPGGDTIPSTLALLLVRLLDHATPLDAAIDAPRLHHGFVPDQIRYEAARPLPKPLLDELTKRGHKLYRSYASQGDVSAIVLSGASAFGYADPREGPGLALAAQGVAPAGGK
jgi:gamma-glutamyltranspeptidase/glutathione hydrolase